MKLQNRRSWLTSIGAAAFGCGWAAVLLLPVPVSAQSGGQGAAGSASSALKAPVTVELKAFKVVRDAEGKEAFVDASRARPGDVLEYRALYANVSSKEVKNLQANLPIPASTELIPASIAPQTALASANNRTFSAMPLMQIVRTPAGETRRPMPYSLYRALRWPVGTLAAGQKITVRARVRLYGTLESPK